MQYPDSISQIKERAANIRLRMNHLADLAGVPPSTAHAKTPDGRERDVRSSTLRKLAEAQVQEELRLRDYLLTLHPIRNEETAA
ncbi:hypothetical protein ACRQ5Q_22535 [Bradyrhizobium sp. PMVTL-01]|uniref:hypothetical protein n=1 Tax=Bradyrhizobium sp. PMVTL-01 TaxID=3434999 RepID=UPI003F71AC66